MPRAETQGLTEKYLGNWLKSRSRDSVVLATKVSGYSAMRTYIRGGETVRVNRQQIRQAIEGSLERLGTDYVDLLQIHWPDRYVPLFGGKSYSIADEREEFEPFEDQLRAFEEVINEGKVRYIGVSNETSYGVMSFIRAAEQYGLPRIISIQNCYHLNTRVQYETDLVETCRFSNVGLLAYSPLAGGTLTGKYLGPESDPKARFNYFKGFMERYMNSASYVAAGEYAKVAEKHGLTPTQLAMAFVKSRDFVSSTIIGATSLEQLKETIAAFDTELSPECLTDIDEVFKKYRDPAMR